MDLRRNLRVLPSNAPALPEDTGYESSTFEESPDTLLPHICQNFNSGLECKSCYNLHLCLNCRQHDHGACECKSGVLQVTSGNAGVNALASHHIGSDLGSPQACGYEDGPLPLDVPIHTVSATLRYEQPRRHTRRSERRPNYWHVEFNTPRYRAYREKCRQKGSREEAKWPDRVEEAFQIALRVYRRRGRKKEVLYGKQSGGNEWISDYIYKATGVRRDRKQVSSHIQVLKNFLCENLPWMSLVVDIKPEKSRKEEGIGAQYDSAANLENNDSDDAANYQHFHDLHRAYPGALLPSVETLGSNVHSGPTIRSVNFLMALFKGEKLGPQVVLHNYTKIQTEMGSAPRALEDISDWRTMFPHLALFYDRGEAQAPIFLFESNISLMNIYPGEGSSLGTELILYYTLGTGYGDWRALTRFYEEKGREIDLKKFSERSQEPGTPYNELDWKPDLNTGDVRLEIPLKSKWWAKLFSDIISGNEKAGARAKKTGNPQMVRDEEEGTRQYLGDISVMQELWATPRINGAVPQRMAFILWNFKQTRRNEAATTSWRRVIPPTTPFEPNTRMMQPHMTLDTVIEEARTQPPISVGSDYYDHSSLQSSVFMDNTGSLVAAPLSEESSPEIAESPDYQSFPSSTTTSFPSSISNSIYPINLSQESEHAVFGSFDSQPSTYEVATHSQEAYEFQDNSYHSQESIYNNVGTPPYEYSPQHAEVAEVAGILQDFTGGHIQLRYEAPMIAPRANMIPQPQLIEHLEQFDEDEKAEQHRDDSSQDQPDLQQAYAEHFPHNIDLNLLATQFNAWEDHLQNYPAIEGQVNDDDALDKTRPVQEPYTETGSQGTLEEEGTAIGQEVMPELLGNVP